MSASIHANCVAVEGRGVLITGASGSGKSGLSLQLIALGARLVADDRCLLSARDGRLWARCPGPIKGQIEARHFGILTLEALPEAEVVAEVNLDGTEQERLPEPKVTERCGIALPLIKPAPGLHFASALFLYLRTMRTN